MRFRYPLLLMLVVINTLYKAMLASGATHMYTLHKTAHTWNEARELCNKVGTQLLTIHNSTEWHLWEYLMSSDLDSHLRPSNRYWFGLHAPDPDQPDAFYWDTCDAATYTEPLTTEIGATKSYECVVAWFHREVFVSAYLSMWIQWTACNETFPYICMTPAHGAKACVWDCDEIVAPSTSSVCESACDNQSLRCNSSYNTELEVCHLKVNISAEDKEYLNICVLPTLQLDGDCSSSYVTPMLPSVNDDNMNVTNRGCVLKETTTINTTPTSEPTSLISPTPAASAFVSASYVTEESVCICACATLNLFLTEPEPDRANLTVEEKIDIIVKELTIDKKNTTSSQRKLISVMDYRASSVGLGSLSAGIIVTIIGIIVAIDLSRLVHGLANILRKVVKMLKKNRVNTIKVGECPKPDQAPELSNDLPLEGQEEINDILRPRKMMTPHAPIETRF